MKRKAESNVTTIGRLGLPYDEPRRINRRIGKAGMYVMRVVKLVNNQGYQHWLSGGGVVTVYRTGNFQIQGRLLAIENENIHAQLVRVRKAS